MPPPLLVQGLPYEKRHCRSVSRRHEYKVVRGRLSALITKQPELIGRSRKEEAEVESIASTAARYGRAYIEDRTNGTLSQPQSAAVRRSPDFRWHILVLRPYRVGAVGCTR